MNHLDLFSGIGGFALAASTVWGPDHHVVGFCDNDLFCQNVLKKHWPTAPIYGDIRELTAEKIRFPETIDLITGGVPCQPASAAGKRRGTKDDRWLWPEATRVIHEFRPRTFILENVRGLLSLGGGVVFETLCLDLEAEGYAVQPFIIPACAVGAPHRRDRVWIVGKRHDQIAERHGADPGRERRQGNEQPGAPREGARTSRSTAKRDRDAGDAASAGLPVTGQAGERQLQAQGRKGIHHRPQLSGRDAADASRSGRGQGNQDGRRSGEGTRPAKERRGFTASSWSRDWRAVALETCAVHDRVDDGLPERMARLPDGSEISLPRLRRESLKAYGNAIVPQVAVEIMTALKAGGLA